MTNQDSRSQSSASEPDARTLDLLLDDYERELELRETSDCELGSVVARLRRALERWSADGSAFEEVRDARSTYVSKLAEWQDLLKEWIPIRGSGSRLEPTVEFMTDKQWKRFNLLEARAAQGASAPGTLDADHQVVRPLLLRFEEFAKPPDRR